MSDSIAGLPAHFLPSLRAWADAFPYPEDYTSIDCETTGLDVDHDRVLQIGWCRVENRKSVENAGVAVNCAAGMSDVERSFLRHRIRETAARMADRGLVYEWSLDRIATGLPARQAAASLAAACPSDHVVSHYGISFDYHMIDRFCREHGAGGLPDLTSGRLLDTYVLYKAAAVPILPRSGESYASAVSRTNAARTKLKCSMSALVASLGLTDRGAVVRRAHDAIYDSWLASLAFERLRELAGGSP